MVVIKQGGTAEVVLNASNGMIDRKIKTPVLFYCTLVSGVEIAVEQNILNEIL